jgi:porin
MTTKLVVAVVSGAALLAVPAAAQQADFGGPDAVGNVLQSDREQRDTLFDFTLTDPYFAFKDRMQEKFGLSFGLDYTALGFAATEGPGDDQAASGIARFFGSWDLIGRESGNTGTFVFKVEDRHRYSNTAPGGLGFELGYVGLLNPPFSDQGERLTNLYWRQRLFGGRAAVTLGFLDTTDYVDPYALGSPWTHFGNFVFSTGSATIGLPDDGTLGAAAAGFLTDNIYAIAGIADANADSGDPFEGFDTFFDESEYFTSLEVGYTTSPERLIFDNVHLTLWNTDGSDDLGVDDGWGANVSATWYVNDRWLPFLRAGYSKDGGALLQRSISAGLGWQPRPGPGRDVLGIGVNWGEPNEESFGSGLDDQWTGELFYRLNLTRELALTPSFQLLVDPALNPDDDVIGVFGLRGRVAL